MAVPNVADPEQFTRRSPKKESTPAMWNQRCINKEDGTWNTQGKRRSLYAAEALCLLFNLADRERACWHVGQSYYTLQIPETAITIRTHIDDVLFATEQSS